MLDNIQILIDAPPLLVQVLLDGHRGRGTILRPGESCLEEESID